MEFLAQRDPKGADSFLRFASLPVIDSDSCFKILTAIVRSCVAHPSNRFSAGPAVVNRVCAMVTDGLLTDGGVARSWVQAIVTLIGPTNDSHDPMLNVNPAAFASAGGVDMLRDICDRYLGDVDVCCTVVDCIGLLVCSSATVATIFSSGCFKRMYSIMAHHIQTDSVCRGSETWILCASELRQDSHRQLRRVEQGFTWLSSEGEHV